MFQTGKYQLGLDIGTQSIKGVEMRFEDGDQTATAYGVQKRDPENSLEEDLTAFRKNNDFATKHAATAISGRSVLIRYLTVPAEELEDFETDLKGQAEKFIPFDVEEASLDYETLTDLPEGEEEFDPDQEVRVLVVAAKQSFVEERADLLEDAGFVTDRVEIEALALGNAFDLYLHSQEDFDQNRYVGIIDIGVEKSLIHIMQGDESYFAREIFLGGDDFTTSIATSFGISEEEAEEKKLDPGKDVSELIKAVRKKLDDLCNEIHLSFDYFETQFDDEVDEIYVTGGGSLVPGLEESMFQTLHKKPNIWDPFESIPIDLRDQSLQDLREETSFLAVATGLACRL